MLKRKKKTILRTFLLYHSVLYPPCGQSHRERADRQTDRQLKLWHKQSKKGPIPPLPARQTLLWPWRRQYSDTYAISVSTSKHLSCRGTVSRSSAVRDRLEADGPPVSQWLGFCAHICVTVTEDSPVSHVWGYSLYSRAYGGAYAICLHATRLWLVWSALIFTLIKECALHKNLNPNTPSFNVVEYWNVLDPNLESN